MALSHKHSNAGADTALADLHVEAHGRGETLLLHQGLGQASWAWRDQVDDFAGRFRRIVFDTRGTGRSPAAAEPTTIGGLARDAATILAGHRAHVVGFSLGGFVALTLALARPELVRSLVLVGTGAGGPNRVPRAPQVRQAFERARVLPPEQQRRATLPYTFSTGWPERNRDRFEEILAASLMHPTPLETIDAQITASYGYFADPPLVERIEVPALVVHGSEDLIIPPENGRELARRLPNARLVELAGRGHNLQLEDPETFNALVLDFLDAR